MEDKLRNEIKKIVRRCKEDLLDSGYYADQILELFQQHKKEYLESILPEKKQCDEHELAIWKCAKCSILVEYNACLDEIRRKAKLE